MEKQIKRLTRTLQWEYAFFILIPLLICIAYEMGLLAEGLYAADPGMQYILETGGILLAIALVPFSLKLFSVVMNKKIKEIPLEKAIPLYRNWSSIRFLMLGIVVIPNVIVYYLTLNNIGGLCALIGVTASLFCLPGEKRIKEDLDITNPVEQ